MIYLLLQTKESRLAAVGTERKHLPFTNPHNVREAILMVNAVQAGDYYGPAAPQSVAGNLFFFWMAHYSSISAGRGYRFL